VIEIPSKHYDRTDVTYLTEPEIDAVLAAPNRKPGSAAATTR